MLPRLFLAAVVLTLLAAGPAQAQTTTQPTGPAASFCAPQTLSYGAAPIQATIAGPGGAGCYRFDGAAGDRVRIRLIPTGGNLDPAATTARPNGTSLCPTTTQNEITCVLDATGRHSITVADAAGTKPGHYAISIQRLNDPVGCGPGLSFTGNVAPGSLTAAGDSECHRFNATTGDRVRVNLQATTPGLNPAVEVVRPDGSPLCGITGGPLTCTATVTGLYTLLVRDPLPGSYGVALQRLQNPVGCTELLSGYGPHTREIPAAGGMRCFRVTEDSSARLRVRVIPVSGTLIPTAEVLRPDGTTRCAETAADDSTCWFDVSGRHTILVRDGGQAGTGGFTIALQRLDAPSGCSTHSFGTLPASNLLYPGDVECHRFAAVAGDDVRIRVRARGATPSLRPAFEVIRPGGTTSCSATDELTCPIPVTGTYTVLVRDQSPGNRTGGYELSVQRLNAPVGCTLAAFGPRAERADLEDGETDCMRIEGDAGDRIRFRTVPVHGMQPVTEVIRPDGTTQCSRVAAESVTCLLDTSGPHLVLVRDATGERSGEHWWSIQRLDDPVGCGTLTSGLPPMVGGVGVAGTPCWRFVGEVDERVRLKVNDLWGEWKPYFEIVRPDGRTLGAQTGTITSFDSFWYLHDTGTHTVFLRDDDRGYDTGQYNIQLFRG